MKEDLFFGGLLTGIPRELILLMISGMAVFLLTGLFIVGGVGRLALLVCWLVWSACCIMVFSGRRDEGRR